MRLRDSLLPDPNPKTTRFPASNDVSTETRAARSRG